MTDSHSLSSRIRNLSCTDIYDLFADLPVPSETVSTELIIVSTMGDSSRIYNSASSFGEELDSLLTPGQSPPPGQLSTSTWMLYRKCYGSEVSRHKLPPLLYSDLLLVYDREKGIIQPLALNIEDLIRKMGNYEDARPEAERLITIYNARPLPKIFTE